MSRIKSLLSVPVLIAVALGCTAVAKDEGKGRLDLVIRPDNAVASSRPVQGHFVVRNLELGQTERIEVGSSYETLSVPLPEGAYTLAWQPVLPPLRTSDDPAVWASELGAAAEAHPLSINAGRVTTVRVRAQVPSPGAEELARAEDLPSVDIVVARR